MLEHILNIYFFIIYLYIEYIFYSLGASQPIFVSSTCKSASVAAPGQAAYLTSPLPLHPPCPHPHPSRPHCPCQVHPSWLLQGIRPSVSSPGPASLLDFYYLSLAVSFIMVRSRETSLGSGPACWQRAAESRRKGVGAETEWHVEEDEQMEVTMQPGMWAC